MMILKSYRRALARSYKSTTYFPLTQLNHSTNISSNLNKPSFLKAISLKDRTSSIAIVDDLGQLSYGELDSLSTKLANIIVNQKLLSPSTKTIASYNKSNRYYVLSMIATWKLGLRFLPLCPSHPDHELSYFINDAQAKLVLYSYQAPPITGILDSTITSEPPQSQSSSINNNGGVGLLSLDIKTTLDKSWPNTANPADTPLASNTTTTATSSSSLCLSPPLSYTGLIVYTSGTTGQPKGVLHDESNLFHMIQSLEQSWKYSATDKILHFLPLHHIHGILNKLLCLLYVGGTVEFIADAKPLTLWKRLSQEECENESSTQSVGNVLEHTMTERKTTSPTIDDISAAATSAPTNTPLTSSSGSGSERKRLTLFMAVPTIYAKMAEELKRFMERHNKNDINSSRSQPLDTYESIMAATMHDHSSSAADAAAVVVAADGDITTDTTSVVPATAVTAGSEQQSNDLTLHMIQQGLRTLSVMRLHVSGSAALPEPLFTQWHKLTKKHLLERYGMTELGMVLSNPYVSGHTARVSVLESVPGSVPVTGSESVVSSVGSVGVPLPYVQCRLVDEQENDIVSANTPGELRVTGKTVMKEYLNQPQITAQSFDAQGYFKTGDTARLDEHGCYHILGRSSTDIIKSAGYKLSALEIEREILSHPCVVESAVFGAYDEILGEQVVAIVVWRDDSAILTGAATTSSSVATATATVVSSKASSLTSSKAAAENENERELRNFLQQRLAKYKQPRVIQFMRHGIPRNHLGKVNKKALKKELGFQ